MVNNKDKTSFGFKDVNISEKSNLVKSVFESVALNYDLMNDLMSIGIHRMWKNQFVDMISDKEDMFLLDVAGGTGDIAFRFLNSYIGKVLVCDLTEDMIKVGKSRALDKGIIEGIDWVVGDAQALPLADNSVDVYTISFGLRNVTDIDLALSEAHRVLKVGGQFLCLEFSQVVLPLLSKLYDTYSFNILPKLGELITGDKDSYTYLVESIRKFPNQDLLLSKLELQGFTKCCYKNLSGGISAIHMGYKL